MDREKAFQLLGIVPGDSLEAAKAKYRIKAKKCHPDRFSHDPALMKAAEIKMTQVNLAYQVVCTHLRSSPTTSESSKDPVLGGNSLISWVSRFHWSMVISTPLFQKAVGFLGFQSGSGSEESCVVDSVQDAVHTREAFARESFEEILQRKVADMKNSTLHKK